MKRRLLWIGAFVAGAAATALGVRAWIDSRPNPIRVTFVTAGDASPAAPAPVGTPGTLEVEVAWSRPVPVRIVPVLQAGFRGAAPVTFDMPDPDELKAREMELREALDAWLEEPGHEFEIRDSWISAGGLTGGLLGFASRDRVDVVLHARLAPRSPRGR